jgi:hypothetical protein
VARDTGVARDGEGQGGGIGEVFFLKFILSIYLFFKKCIYNPKNVYLCCMYKAHPLIQHQHHHHQHNHSGFLLEQQTQEQQEEPQQTQQSLTDEITRLHTALEEAVATADRDGKEEEEEERGRLLRWWGQLRGLFSSDEKEEGRDFSPSLLTRLLQLWEEEEEGMEIDGGLKAEAAALLEAKAAVQAGLAE